MFSSLIGYDSLYAKDNLTYTRPWGADYTPYLMLGVNASYPVTDALTATGFVLNGYWHLANANRVPSVGGQLAYKASDRITVTLLWRPRVALIASLFALRPKHWCSSVTSSMNRNATSDCFPPRSKRDAAIGISLIRRRALSRG